MGIYDAVSNLFLPESLSNFAGGDSTNKMQIQQFCLKLTILCVLCGIPCALISVIARRPIDCPCAFLEAALHCACTA
jgi:hypothetical protein